MDGLSGISLICRWSSPVMSVRETAKAILDDPDFTVPGLCLPSYNQAMALPTDGVLTIAEIEGKFESEWVLIEDPSTDDHLQVRGGTVRCHGKDRDEVYRRAVQIRPGRFAIVYTGTMPGDTTIAL